MANEQMITEIISESAFKQLDKLYEDLQRATDQYAKFGSQILDVNKDISGSKSMADLEKALEKQVLIEEKITQAKLKTQLAEEKLAQTKLRTLMLSERQAEKEAALNKKTEDAIKSKEAAAKRAADNEKKSSESAYNAAIKVVVSEKEKQKALEASEALARSASASNKQRAEAEEALRQKQSLSFKGMIKMTAQSEDSLKEYGTAVNDLINKQLALRSSLKILQSEFKELGSDATPQQIKEFTLAQNQHRVAISQNGTELKRLIREQTAAEGSFDRLSARLDSLRATYRKLTPAQRENEESAKAIAQEISELDTILKNADKSMGVHNREVGNYALGMQGLEDSLNKVSPALGGFVSQLREAFNATKALIASPLGAFLAAIAAVIGGAKLWYDYNKGIQEATKLTKQFTDLQGDDLKIFRSEVEALSDVYNKDFKEVLIAVNATAKNFGLSFNDSLALVQKGFLAGADASGDFLNQLKEYPTQLEFVGMSAEQTISLITQNVKDGIFSDKGIDAIKEAGLSIREMTKATSDALTGIGLDSKKIQKDLESGQTTIFEVIKQVSQRLSELPPQSAAVGTAIADIFKGAGEDAGLRYLVTLKDIDLGLDALIEKQGAIAEAEQLQIEATSILKQEFAALFDQTGGGFELLIANAKLFATDLLIKMIRGTADLFNWFVRLYNSSKLFRIGIEAIQFSFKQVWNAAKTMFNFFFDGFATLGKTIEAILSGNFSDLGQIISDGFKKSAGNWKEFGSELGKNFVDGLNDIVSGNLQEIDLSLNAGGSLDTANGLDYGGNGKPTGKPDKDAEKAKRAREKAEKEAIKNKKELEQRLLDLSVERLKAEENALKRSADKAKDIATDEKNGYEDRLLNLQSYLKKSDDLLTKSQENQKKQNAKYLIEADALEKSGRIKDAEALRELVLLKNKEIDQAVNEQRAEMIKSGNDILASIYAKDTENRINQVYSSLETQAQERMNQLAKAYASGEINEREYAEEREKTSNQLANELIQSEINVTQSAIELAKMRGLNVSDQEKKLAELKMKLSKETSDQQISDLEKVAEREKQLNELKKDLAQELSDMTFSLLNASIERDLQRLDTDLENINKKSEEEKKAIEESTLSEEEKNARLFALEQKKQVQTEQIEAKKAQLKLRQAKLDRAQNILSIIGNTAAGIMKAFADLGPIAGIPFAAIIGAMGAAQLISVVSQPLPQYYKGTENSKEGFAHVGERGSELMIEPNGNMLLTPDRDTVTYLQKGTKILTHENTKRAFAQRSLRNFDNRPNVNREFESNLSKLVDENKAHNKKMISSMNKKSYFGTVITKDGWKSQTLNGQKLNNWKRKNGI